MEKIEEIIAKYKREIHNYEKYINGQWACEIDRISGMKIAVDVLKDMVKDLEQLKSSLPKPVEVPEFVAEWIEDCKANATLVECINGEYETRDDYFECIKEDVDWIVTDENEEILARAWLDGYTVVKEPKKHVLKLDSEYYDDVVSGFKKFEIRFNDRDYKVGDILVLEEYDGIDYTGDRCKRIVTYITDYAQQDGYVVLGIEPVKKDSL